MPFEYSNTQLLQNRFMHTYNSICYYGLEITVQTGFN